MVRFREPVNGFTHLAGAVLGAFGLLWLLAATWGAPDRMIVALVYGLSMILLYAASAAYHLIRGPEWALFWLWRCDHAAIYGLIAGTYTPFLYILLDGIWRWGMLALVWGLALVGIILKLAIVRRGGWWSLGFYLLLGWVGLIAVPAALHAMPAGAALLLLGGGAAYTVGAVFFALRRPNFHPHFGHHELWHLCVLAGSALHFAAVIGYII